MSSEQTNKPSAGRALSPGAAALMLMLCLSWGFNQIAVKLVLPDVPPMLQALSRSVGALPVLLIIGWLRGVKFFERDGTLWPGVCAGVIFGIEFVLIYQALLFTSASRAVVFLYIAPFFVALGSYIFLGERLRAAQWAGLGLSFAGVALAIGVPQANVDSKVLFGDLLIVCGGALWAATTLLVKAYSASKLSAFTFITPLFGVVASYVILHDTLTLAFGAAALLVVAGLYLVNRPEAARAEVAPDPNV